MATLKVTNEQLRLIQDDLDFYARVGIGQMTTIKDHPTFAKMLKKMCKGTDGKTNYAEYHKAREIADMHLSNGRNFLLKDFDMGIHASYGIHSPDVDETCLEAYDIIQVIRHEFWKADPDRPKYVVSADVTLWTKDGDKIKCEIDQ